MLGAFYPGQSYPAGAPLTVSVTVQVSGARAQGAVGPVTVTTTAVSLDVPVGGASPKFIRLVRRLFAKRIRVAGARARGSVGPVVVTTEARLEAPTGAGGQARSGAARVIGSAFTRARAGSGARARCGAVRARGSARVRPAGATARGASHPARVHSITNPTDEELALCLLD